MTTEKQIEKARKIVQELQEVIGLGCTVTLDDWSDYASFRTFITLPVLNVIAGGVFFTSTVNLRKIGWQIKRVSHSHSLRVEIERIEMPRQSYHSWDMGKMSKGYNNSFIMLNFRVFNC